MELAKRLHVSRELALLRATNPHPPMVSFFDLVDEGAIRKGVAREEAAAAARREEPSEIEVKDFKQSKYYMGLSWTSAQCKYNLSCPQPLPPQRREKKPPAFLHQAAETPRSCTTSCRWSNAS